MTMPVTPGGAYFGFYSDFGDLYRGEPVSYAVAVASAAASGARDVLDLVVPDDIGSPTVLSGHPRVLSVSGDEFSFDISTTYDNGYWGEGTDPWYASNFLVEIQGSGAASFVIEGSGAFGIYHYVSSDGGQSIYLSSSTGELFTGVDRVRIWRAEVFPGDPLPEPPSNFWTNFVGSREII